MCFRVSFTYPEFMTTRIPSLNWLRVFEAAARHESFARAAAELNMSPAAVSQQVRALEERLGANLFVREAHSVRLTDTGRAYLPPVMQSLLTLTSATDGLFGKVRERQLYVQSVLIFAHGVLARGLSDFSIRYPDIAMTLTTGNAVMDFKQGFQDIQIIFGNPDLYGRSSEPLFSEWLTPVARPEIAARIGDVHDLADHRLIEVATHRAGWPHFFEQLNLHPGAARYQFADSTIMAAALASEGQGIALARAPASDKVVKEAGLVPCLPGTKVLGAESYHLLHDGLSTMRPAARAFRNWLFEWITDNGFMSEDGTP